MSSAGFRADVQSLSTTTPTLNDSIIGAIISRKVASAIVKSFKKAYRNVDRCDDLNHLRRQFLCAATEYNHKDLLELLLIDLGHYLNGSPRPLYVAIRSGNLELARLLIEAGSTINEIVSKELETSVSAVEICCIYDQPEILEFIFGPNTKQQSSSRDSALHKACHHAAFKCIDYLLTTDVGRASVNAFKCVNYLFNTSNAFSKEFIRYRCDRCIPLIIGIRNGSRMVAKLLDAGAAVSYQIWQNRQTVLHYAVKMDLDDLSEVVRLLVGAGVPLDERKLNGETALNVLLKEARPRDDYNSKKLEMLVDCIRILLEAGARQDANDRYNGMEHLLYRVRSFVEHRPFSRETNEYDKRKLVSAVTLVLLLYTHEIDEHFCSISETSDNANVKRENETNVLLFTMLQIVGKTDLFMVAEFQALVSDLCEVLRCCLLSGNKFIVYNNMKELLPKLILLQCWSVECLRFLRLLLSALNRDQWNGLKAVFVADACTLKWLLHEEAQVCLKQLARHTIVRAMGGRAVRGVATLGLPRSLQDYVVLCTL